MKKNSCDSWVCLILGGALVIALYGAPQCSAQKREANLVDVKLLIWGNQLHKALDLVNRYIQTHPSDRAEIFEKMNRYDDALKDYDRAVQIRPDANRMAKARILKKLGRLEDACRDLEFWVKLNPDCHIAYIELADCLRRQGKFDQALSVFDQHEKLPEDRSRDAVLEQRIAYDNIRNWAISYRASNPSPAAGPVESAASQPHSVSTESVLSAVSKPVSDKWALIMGIGRFKDGRIPALQYYAKDAKDLRRFLIEKCNFSPDHVRLLVDEKATQRRVLSELGDRFLPRVVQPDDLVLIYFSTHGSPAPMDKVGRNYLIAYDSELEDLYASGIEMQKIMDLIRDRIKSQRILLVLDTCYAGAASPGSKGIARSGNFDAEHIAQGSGQLVICSSEPDQRSFESKRYQNSIFTKKLMEGLQKSGATTTLGEAFDYLQHATKIEAQEARGVLQVPVLKSKWNGRDLVLAAPPSNPRPLAPEVKESLLPDSAQVSSPK